MEENNQNINVNNEVQGGEESPNNKQEVQEKMLPQSKINEIVEGRLKREREKLRKEWKEKFNALEESVKLAQMSENQKAEYQAQKERDAFEEERQAFYAERDAFNKSKYMNEIENQLSSRGLPAEIADILVGLDAETVASKIDILANALGVSVNAQIENKLKSSTIPVESTTQPKRLLSRDEIEGMSLEEYRKNRDLINESLANMNKR